MALQLVIEGATHKEYGVVNDISEIKAVGHRVLHSGEDFDRSVIIDEEVIRICKKNARARSSAHARQYRLH